MPWTLTTPVAVGDLDPNGPYTQVKIVSQTHDSVNGIITLFLEYGKTAEGKWVAGLPMKSKQVSVVIQGEDYDTLVEGSEPEVEELTYDAVKRGLYAYLLDEAIIGPGTLT